jgi:voltage-gated potassium channel
MFYAEAEAQPNAFHNILDTFWWSIVTFTTVGYGDVYPITPIGKLLSATIVLIGIMLFALPTSILTAEFLNEFQSKDK